MQQAQILEQTPVTEERTLQAWGWDVLERARGDWEKAIQIGQTELLSDQFLLDEFTIPLLKQGLKDFLISMYHRKRNQAKFYCYDEGGPNVTLPKGVSGEELAKRKAGAKLRAMREVLLGMYLNKCKKFLRSANREDLDIEIEMFETNARGNDFMRIFLSLIQEKVKGQEKVGDVWTEEDLIRLRETAQKKIARRWKR